MPNPNSSLVIAVLVDGGFFLKRYKKVFWKGADHPPETIVANLNKMIRFHVGDDYLLKVLFYDCPPFEKKVHGPVSKKHIDFRLSETALKRRALFDCLKKQRKYALRLGELRSNGQWIINPEKTKDLLAGKTAVSELTDSDFRYDINQKGVDIKIGIDITSFALKKLVHKIILISGDCDFVPASKLARREGIDLVLDPMWNPVQPSLFEHIDGLKSTCPRPGTLPDAGYPFLI